MFIIMPNGGCKHRVTSRIACHTYWLQIGINIARVIICCRCSNGCSPSSAVSPTCLLVYTRRACLPFLRAAALFFHYLTNVPAPLELTTSKSLLHKLLVSEVHFSFILRENVSTFSDSETRTLFQ
jgi:hypothetical protein